MLDLPKSPTLSGAETVQVEVILGLQVNTRSTDSPSLASWPLSSGPLPLR